MSGVCGIRCGRSLRWVQAGLDPEGRGLGGQRWAQGSERACTQARNHRASREAGAGAHLLCSRLRPGGRDEGRRENGPDREEGGVGGGIGPGLGWGAGVASAAGRPRPAKPQAPATGRTGAPSRDPAAALLPVGRRAEPRVGSAELGSPSARRRFKYRRLASAANQHAAGAGREADSQWEAERQSTPTRRFRFRGEGTLDAADTGFLSKGCSPDAPRGEVARGWTVTAEPAVAQESRALLRTRLSCVEMRAREPLPRVSVSPAGQWDRVQRRSKAGRVEEPNPRENCRGGSRGGGGVERGAQELHFPKYSVGLHFPEREGRDSVSQSAPRVPPGQGLSFPERPAPPGAYRTWTLWPVRYAGWQASPSQFPAGDGGAMDSPEVTFTLAYLVFAVCFVFTPTEFHSAGLTVQNLLSGWLGSEDAAFVPYHLRRTAATLLCHSLLPLGEPRADLRDPEREGRGAGSRVGEPRLRAERPCAWGSAVPCRYPAERRAQNSREGGELALGVQVPRVEV